VITVQIRKYDLPDIVLLEDRDSHYRSMVWEPGFTAVVLGQSNHPEEAVRADNVLQDSVPVYKRPSGGESVVLSAKTVIISILKRGDKLKSPHRYFDTYNNQVMEALAALGIKDLTTNGISDICIGPKKILGSSIYRSRDIVLYHAVLNRAESTQIIERYLKHPPREPGYRKGRSHGEFVTSLAEQGYHVTGEQIRQSLLKII